MDKPNPLDFIKDWIKRPEVVTLIVAALVSAAAYLGLPARAGLDVPQDSVAKVVLAFWAVFVGAVFEGKYKGTDYRTNFGGLLNSFKFRAAASTIGVLVLGAVLKTVGADVPDESLPALMDFLIAAILGKAAIDSHAVAVSNAQRQ